MFYEPLAQANESIKLGRDGVVIFFVLSGFVITWCANEREKNIVDFAVNRAARIYSVAIPGILLGMLASLLAYLVDNQELEYPFRKLWIYLPIYLSFTGDFWGLSEFPPGNFPYWSLNYEVWYYIIFAGFFYINNWYRLILAFILMVLVGPDIIELFPLWLAGSGLYSLCKWMSMPKYIARALFMCSLILFVFSIIAGIDNFFDTFNRNRLAPYVQEAAGNGGAMFPLRRSAIT